MAGPLNLAIIATLDAKGVAAGGAEARREIAAVGASASSTAASTRLLSAANDEAAASQRRAMEAARGRAAAERELQDAVAKFAGIRPLTADNDYRQREADIQSYGAALDDLRAKHNPLFAVQRQYQQNLADIDQALKLGAINEAEHSAAVARAGAAHQLQTAMLTQSSGAIKLNAGDLQNLSFQANDFAMMLMSGQSFGVIMAQQGMQVAQIFGNRGLGQIIPALGGSLLSLITPTTLFLGAVTAAGYAGYAAYQAMVPEVKTLDDAVDAHRNSVDLLRDSYGDLDTVLKSISRSGEVAFNFASLRTDQATVRATQRSLGPDLINQLRGGDDWGSWLSGGTVDIRSLTNLRGQQQDFAPAVRKLLDDIRQGRPDLEAFNADVDRLLSQLLPKSDNPETLSRTADAVKLLGQSALEVEPKFAPFTEAINRLQLQMAEGNPDLAQFNRTVEEIGKAKGISELADQAILLGKELLQVNRLAHELQRIQQVMEAGQRGVLLGSSADDARNDYLDQQRNAIRDRQRRFDADMLGMRARSPAEREAAARAEAELSTIKDEGFKARQQRIDDAGLRARVEAEHELTRAQDERRRSLDETLASARLDIDLVGRSVAETERLRMEHQLLAEVRRVAAANNVDVDEAEIERIRQIAAETAKLRAIQQARDFIRTQDEQLEKLRMEQQLVGVSEGLRNRLRAAMEAELEIRRLGIDVGGTEAENMRRRAEETANLTTRTDRLADAWGRVQDATESAIDSAVDKLSKGDLEGFLDDLESTVSKTLLELGAGNPLKNALTGSNYGTLADAGGIGGIFKRLIGGPDAGAEGILSSMLGSSVGAMDVTAGVVNVNGGIGSNFLDGKGGGLLGMLGIDKPGSGSDIIRMPLHAAVGPGGATVDQVAEYIRQAAGARGIDPDIALRVARSEGLAPGVWQSNFINAAGRRETSYGPYQLLTGGGLGDVFERQTGMRASDPAGVYKQVDFALDHAAKNGWGAWYGADKVGVGEWDGLRGARSLDSGLQDLGKSAATSSRAVDTMTTGAISAGDGLGVLGQGAGKLGDSLAGFRPGSGGSGGGGGLFDWISSFFGGGGASADPWAGLRVPTYAVGTSNHPGGPALIHDGGGEVVDLPSGARVWPRDLSVQMANQATTPRTYAEGGYAMPESWSRTPTSGGSAGSGGTVVEVSLVNQTSVPMQTERREVPDGRGGRRQEIVLREIVADAIAARGGAPQQTMESLYGLSPGMPVR